MASLLALLIFIVPVPPQASARRITSDKDLCQGRGADGAVGDYLLTNGRVKVLVDEVSRPHGFAKTGGNILDVAWVDGNVDLLKQVFTYFDNQFPRQAAYTRLDVVDDGSSGKAAVLRATGADTEDAALHVVTDYILYPEAEHLLVRTVLENRGKKSYASFEVGDVVQWGYTDHFAPGYGHHLGGVNATAEWMASVGEGISYGYTIPGGKFFGPNGSNWSDMNVKTVNVRPGARVTYDRYLLVGRGDIASVTDAVYRLRSTPTAQLAGKVQEEGTGTPVPGATVEVLDSSRRPFLSARSGKDGTFSVLLPAGTYSSHASSVGRSPSDSTRFQVSAAAIHRKDFVLSKPGRILYSVKDGKDGRALPAKLTFKGLGASPDPYLGPTHHSAGAQNVIFTGTGEGTSVMPPGLYEVTVSRGIEYEIHVERIQVRPGENAGVSATLDRVVGTRGYLSADFHLHSEFSFDSNIPLRDKIIDLMAEGVELAVATDHNFITDYGPAIRELRAEGWVRSVIGNEVTVSGMIHFNAFPLERNPKLPGNGAILVNGKTPGRLFEETREDPGEEVIQVNHPRNGTIGYFNNFGLDPETGRPSRADYSDEFDAIEVFNGKYVADAQSVLSDWYHLLNRGYRYTATGNSDSHQIVSQEAGYPRNFVLLGTDSPSSISEEDLVRAVREHRIVVSNGPFVEFSAAGKPVGSMVSGGGGPLELEVRVQSPAWVDVSEVEVIANGKNLERFLVGAVPTAEKFRRKIAVRPSRDTWYVVVVRGNRPLSPVLPPAGEREILPLAFTNPIWVDADGNGKFDPPETDR